MDNEIWDNFLTTAVYRKLGTELPIGAIVIGWKQNVHQPGHGWRDLGQFGVKTSWHDSRMPVYILERISVEEMEREKAEQEKLKPAPSGDDDDDEEEEEGEQTEEAGSSATDGDAEDEEEDTEDEL